MNWIKLLSMEATKKKKIAAWIAAWVVPIQFYGAIVMVAIGGEALLSGAGWLVAGLLLLADKWRPWVAWAFAKGSAPK